MTKKEGVMAHVENALGEMWDDGRAFGKSEILDQLITLLQYRIENNPPMRGDVALSDLLRDLKAIRG